MPSTASTSSLALAATQALAAAPDAGQISQEPRAPLAPVAPAAPAAAPDAEDTKHNMMFAELMKSDEPLAQFLKTDVVKVFADVTDPALRAVAMASDMQRDVQELLAGWRALEGRLGFGVGIAQGFATIGAIGFARSKALREERV